VTAQGSVSSCASSSALYYSWKFFDNLIFAPSIVSASADNRKLLLPGYTLQAGHTYQCRVTVQTDSGSSASATLSVFVQAQGIATVVAGGYTRSAPVDSILLLDASGSTDLNIKPVALGGPVVSSKLAFLWSCRVVSSFQYGSKCNYIFQSKAALTQPIIAISNMTENFKYAITVTCSSGDGRSGSAVVSVTPTFAGAGVVQMVTVNTRFNQGSTVKVSGRISAASAQFGNK
jgi:hypothetical protein